MKQFDQILKTLKEAYTETERKADELRCSNHLIAREYFLGRQAGIQLAIAIIESEAGSTLPAPIYIMEEKRNEGKEMVRD